METHDLDKTYGFIKWKDSRTSYGPNEISSKTQIPKNKKTATQRYQESYTKLKIDVQAQFLTKPTDWNE